MTNTYRRNEQGGMLKSVSTLPPNKRYILTHDKKGKSIVHSSPPQLYWGVPTVGGVARSCMLCRVSLQAIRTSSIHPSIHRISYYKQLCSILPISPSTFPPTKPNQTNPPSLNSHSLHLHRPRNPTPRRGHPILPLCLGRSNQPHEPIHRVPHRQRLEPGGRGHSAGRNEPDASHRVDRL